MKREIRLDYLFTTYGRERFLNWCRSLNIFRFCKSHSYPDDLHPDRFVTLVYFHDDSELDQLLTLMKIKINSNDNNNIIVENIESTFHGLVNVNDEKCYIHINKIAKTIFLEVSGIKNDPFSLDDTTFQRAKKIDDFLVALDINFISSPYDDDYCITPEFYPQIWK
jgi:hypothetical protein